MWKPVPAGSPAALTAARHLCPNTDRVIGRRSDDEDRCTGSYPAYLASVFPPGARVTKEPVDAEFFNGRSAYLFEVAWADEPDNPVVAATRRAAGA
ncbi:MAG: uncharacterized protein QOJ56_1581 [Mycobacterium sp.]|nr:uncharacterized protein [Mycobacterium sp.]